MLESAARSAANLAVSPSVAMDEVFSVTSMISWLTPSTLLFCSLSLPPFLLLSHLPHSLLSGSPCSWPRPPSPPSPYCWPPNNVHFGCYANTVCVTTGNESSVDMRAVNLAMRSMVPDTNFNAVSATSGRPSIFTNTQLYQGKPKFYCWPYSLHHNP